MKIIDIVNAYNGTLIDKEFLVLIGCLLSYDGECLSNILDIIKNRTDNIWSYIDKEMYLQDFEPDSKIGHVFDILHRIILSTKSIRRTVQIARSYNNRPATVFYDTFLNFGYTDVFQNRQDAERKIEDYMMLMTKLPPVGLGLWSIDIPKGSIPS